MPHNTQLKWQDHFVIPMYAWLQAKINTFTKPIHFPEITAICYFEEPWAYPSINDHTQQLWYNLFLASIDIWLYAINQNGYWCFVI